MIGDISYKNYKKKSDIHGAVLYPAVMVAPVQKDILKSLINKNSTKSVFDPFHGSGTALFEALEIDEKIKLVGCDINPLANMITKVKLQGVSNNIDRDIIKIKLILEEKELDENFSFHNIDKWFREDIAQELRKIRTAIMRIEDKKNRLYFWCMLCDIVRKYSNTRSSTYKLHIKSPDMIKNIKNNVIKDYILSIENNLEKFKNRSSDFALYKCDVLKKIDLINDNTFDISITSPPYGENATTVTYGQFSILALYWIDKKDLELEGWELDNYNIIDSRSLGGSFNNIMLNDFENSLVEKYLNKISAPKKKKVIRFFSDYFIFLRELCRVTKKYIVLTLGNRTVDGIKINLTEISMRFLENNGFVNIELIERTIPNKRIPKIIYKKDNKIINSMNFEYIIIHKKN